MSRPRSKPRARSFYRRVLHGEWGLAMSSGENIGVTGQKGWRAFHPEEDIELTFTRMSCFAEMFFVTSVSKVS